MFHDVLFSVNVLSLLGVHNTTFVLCVLDAQPKNCIFRESTHQNAMATKVGIAFVNRTDSYKAGVETAETALINGKIEKPHFALVFCSGKHNPHQFLAGVRSITGDMPLVGGSAIGIITNHALGYEGYETGIAIFSSDTITFKTFKQGNINIDERVAGEALGKKIASLTDENDKGLLVFYDSSKQQSPPMLNFATLLFEGIQKYLPAHITCAGGGLLSDMQLNTTYQFFNDEVLSQHAVAVALGGCQLNTTIMHGCKPSSAYLTITSAEGPVVKEINHRPALDVISELLGEKNSDKWKDFALFVTLGVNRGDKFAPFDEKAYANRLVLAIDEPSRSIIMFEPDLKPGDEVQLMRRSVDLAYIRSGMDDIRKQMNGSTPLYAFYINCAGRAKPYCGGQLEDAEEVQRSIGAIPFMGFYSGVEVAQVNDRLQPLDWTGVLCILSQ
jgi:hypothetical protein